MRENDVSLTATALLIALVTPFFGAQCAEYKSPDEAVRAFLEPMAKRGRQGVSESASLISDFSKITNTENGEPKELSSYLMDKIPGGKSKVVEAVEVSREEKLRGNVVAATYEIRLTNGDTFKLDFTLIKPSPGGNFEIAHCLPAQ